MAINSEWIKLLSILGIGMVTIVVGFRKQQKHIKEKNRLEGHYSDTKSTLMPKEEKAKNFIEAYKSKFSKEAIAKSLKAINIEDDKIEEYINKYY